MDVSLKDLRAFAVRNQVDVTFHVRMTNAAWRLNRRGLVAYPSIGDATVSGVEDTLTAADAFVVEDGKSPSHPLSRAAFIELMATRATFTAPGRAHGDE